VPVVHAELDVQADGLGAALGLALELGSTMRCIRGETKPAGRADGSFEDVRAIGLSAVQRNTCLAYDDGSMRE
jgi:hypothetical protein